MRSASALEVLVGRDDHDQLGRHAAALERRADPLARAASRAPPRCRPAAPRRSRAPARPTATRAPPRTADRPDRRGLQQRAPARPQHGDAAEALVAQLARAVVGEVVQAADRRQQLGEHALGPRLADRVGERVGERVELVEDRGGRAAQVAGAPRGGDERPQRLRRTAIHRPETRHPLASHAAPHPPAGRQAQARPLGQLGLAHLEADHAADRAGGRTGGPRASRRCAGGRGSACGG